MALKYTVPEYKKVRVIIDTDAACEADDPYAIAQALMSPKLDVKAIFAEHFGVTDSTKQSYDEICTITKLMGSDVPVFMGESSKLDETIINTSEVAQSKTISPASEFLIQEALKKDSKKLFVLCLGAITNVASAILKQPEIIDHMSVIWIGGQSPDETDSSLREFNCGNDVVAANVVISSGVEFIQVPHNVYSSMSVGLAELESKVLPCGKIGNHLFTNMVTYNLSERAKWTQGESWTLGDSPAVGIALNVNCGKYIYRTAPIFNNDTTHYYPSDKNRPQIKICTQIDSRYILEDFFCKLRLLYGSNKD